MNDETEEQVAPVPMVKPEELDRYWQAMVAAVEGILAAHSHPNTSGLPDPVSLADMASAYAGAAVIEYRQTEAASIAGHNGEVAKPN